jgi:hypothetical protein
LNACRTYRAITVVDTAYLHSLAIVFHRKKIRGGGKRRLYLISFEGYESSLDMHLHNMISKQTQLDGLTQTSVCLYVFKVNLVTMP